MKIRSNSCRKVWKSLLSCEVYARLNLAVRALKFPRAVSPGFLQSLSLAVKWSSTGPIAVVLPLLLNPFPGVRATCSAIRRE